MPSITLELPVATTVVNAGLHAANYSDLQSLLNGGLDVNNIANSAVTNAKLSLPYATYTPSWTSAGTAPAIGNGTIEGRYAQIGKTVHFSIELSMGSSTTFGSANPWQFSLPVTGFANNIEFPIGTATSADVSAGSRGVGTLILSTTTTCYIRSHSSVGTSNPWLSTIPYNPWAQDDYVIMTGTYEAA